MSNTLICLRPVQIRAELKKYVIKTTLRNKIIKPLINQWPGIVVGNGPVNTTILKVTQISFSGSEFYVNSSGVSYIHEQDHGNLRPHPLFFLQDDAVQFFLNGSNLLKEEEVIWSSMHSFILNFDTDPGDYIKILS